MDSLLLLGYLESPFPSVLSFFGFSGCFHFTHKKLNCSGKGCHVVFSSCNLVIKSNSRQLAFF